jgi:hypothetical protein
MLLKPLKTTLRETSLKLLSVGLVIEWIGAGFNTLVCSLNGGYMPVPSVSSIPPTPYEKWIPITDETRLIALSDIIALPSGNYSIGDFLVYLGSFVATVFLILFIVRRLRRVSAV